MVDHFVYQIVGPPIVEFEGGISQVSAIPQFIAASGQTDAGSVRRPNVLVADQTTVPLTPAISVDRFLKDARGVDIKYVILKLEVSR